MHRRRCSVVEIVRGTLQLFRRRMDQVKPPDNIENPLFTTDLPGIFRYVANPGVRTAGYNNKTCTGTICEGGVVPQEIRDSGATGQDNRPLSRISLLEGEPPGNLSQKDQIAGDPDRRIRQVHREMTTYFSLIHRRTGIGKRGFWPGAEAERVGDNLRDPERDTVDSCFVKVPDKSAKPSRMIEVSVGQDNVIQIPQAHSHLLGIGKKYIRVPGIEQDLLFVSFKEDRKAGFSGEIPVRQGAVINKDGKGKPGVHKEPSGRPGIVLSFSPGITAIPEAAKVLGIPGRESLNGIHARFRELAKEWHPDVSGNDPDLSHVMFIRIREAYDILVGYGMNYEISFLAEDIRKGTHYDSREFWISRFGDDPIWS